ncbi:hypothetical protein BASA81_003851 [Batrachochytrium salamandrivorans]|nr:hypothetical protein BASA81_003851 [Batrachochytrium salamandrivorans]
MACRLGVSSPLQLWTGVVEYRERPPTPPLPSSVLLFESCRVVGKDGQLGLVIKMDSDTATVQWDAADSLPTSHLLGELKLAQETPPSKLAAAAKRPSLVIESAKFGQKQVWGATLTLPELSEIEENGEGYLDLCDFRARIRVSYTVRRGVELVLVEEELVCGRNCDWQSRFNQDEYQPGTRYELQIHPLELVGEFEFGTVKFQRKRLFNLSPDAHALGIRIEEDEVQHVGLSGEDSLSGVALAEVGFARGVYYWEIRVESAEEHGTVFLGLAERPVSNFVFPSGTPMPGLSRWEKLARSWGFINFRATQSSTNGGVEQIYGEFFETDNVVGVLLDMDQGEVSFFIDALKYGEHVMRDLGVAFTPAQLHSRHPQKFNPNGDAVQYLYPALGLKKSMDNSLSVSNKYIAFPSTEPEEEIVNLAMLKLVLTRSLSSNQRKPFPDSVQTHAYQHYCRMLQAKYKRYPSRAGGRLVEVDVSQEALSRACQGNISPALRVGEICKTMQSQGRELSLAESALILGTIMGKVWYQIQTVSNHEGFGDGATWAFYWEAFELGMLIREEAAVDVISSPFVESPMSREEFTQQCLDNCAWTPEQDDELVRIVNNTLQLQGEQDAMNLDLSKLPPVSSKKRLGRIAVLRLVNCMAKCALPLLSEQGLSKVVHDNRHLLFTTTKRAFWDAVLKATTHATALPGEEYVDPPQIRVVQINRIKATPAKLVQISDPGKRLKRSVFGQLYAETLRWPDYSFRRSYAGKGHGGQKRAFKVKLIGEGVDDYGGPYRQVFEAICDELQNDSEPDSAGSCLLPLLLPCPNRLHSVGDFGRDKFVLNCSADTPSLLRRFEFLGKLIGTAMRHGLQLGFHFPEFVWRQLVGLSVSLKHLEEIDLTFCQDLRRLEVDPGEGRKFQVTLSDGKTIVCHSKHQFVDSGNVKEYVSFATEARLQESALQFQALKRGLACIVPVEHFALFSADEFEVLVCGTRGLDVELLKSVTEFEGLSSADEHVQWFWQVLEETTLLQRELFLIFVWARSRMPNRAEILTRFRLQQSSGAAKDSPDLFLPTAQTCFFSLSLPKYSSKEILRTKLIMAIELTSSMDADVRLRNAEGWAD